MHIMNMNFGAHKTAVEVIKEGALRGTDLKDISSGINGLEKWFRKSWKEFDELKNIDQIEYRSKNIAQIIMILVLINMVLNVEHH